MSKIGRITAVVFTALTLSTLGIPGSVQLAYADPSATPVASITGMESTALTNITVATFTETSSPETYSATVDWGDGTPLDSGTTITGPDGSGVYTVTGSHTYGEELTGHISVTVKGSAGGSSTVNDPVSIAESTITLTTHLTPPYPMPEAGEGFPLTWTIQIGNATNDNLDDFSAVVVWGDGSANILTDVPSPAGYIADDPTLGPTIFATHIFYEEGTYSGLATVSEDGTSMFLGQSLAVGDDTVNVKAPMQTPVEGFAFSAPVATFTDTNPLSNIGDFTPPPPATLKYDPCNPPGTLPAGSPPPPKFGFVCIDWGDGTISDGQVTSTGGGTYSVAGTHTFQDEGTYPVKVTVHDEGQTDPIGTSTVTYKVADALLTPSPVAVTGTEGTALSAVPVATFTDVNSLASASDFKATIDWGDGSVDTGVAVTGPDLFGIFTVPGTHTYNDEGSFPIKVTVSDDGGVSFIQATTATIGEGDSVALTGEATPIAASTGHQFTMAVATFTDTLLTNTAGDFTATIDWGDGVTSTGTITGSSGNFSVTGSHTYALAANPGPTITVTVTDPGGNAIPPVMTPTDVTQGDAVGFTYPPVTATEGVAFTGVVAHFTDTSTTATAGQFTANVSWCGGPAVPAIVAANPSGGFDVVAGHTFNEEGPCPYTVNLSIGTLQFTSVPPLPTANVGDAALAAALASIPATEGAALTSVPVATFTDANAGAVAADFSAIIDWGDGVTDTGVPVTGPVAGVFTVPGTHTYTTTGTFNVKVTINDDGGSSATTSGTITIGDAALHVTLTSPTITEGQPFSGVVADLTDADPGATPGLYIATVNWGDGSQSTGTVTGPTGGPFQVSASHSYAEEGSGALHTYPVSVNVLDKGGASNTTTGTFTVGDAPLALSLTAIAPVEGAGPVFNLGTFTDSDPGGVLGDYSASVDWGDGTTVSSVTVTNASGGRFALSAAHAYAEEGTYPVKVTVNDSGGASTAATMSVTVADAALSGALKAPAVIEGVPFSGAVAGFTDADPNGAAGDYTAAVNWGDGSPLSSATFGGGGPFTVNSSHTYNEEGTYPVTVLLADKGGGLTTISGLWTVSDAGLIGQYTPVTATEGAVFKGTVATFTDPDPTATVTDYAASITWGDGHNSIGTIAGSAGSFTVTGTNTYGEEGSFPVTVTITDAGGSVILPSGNATVADAPLKAGTITLKAGTPSSSEVATMTFTDTDPSGMAGDYAVSINWGDGSPPTAGTASAVSGGFSATGSHSYAKKGTFSVTVTVTDTGGQSKSLTGSATKK